MYNSLGSLIQLITSFAGQQPDVSGGKEDNKWKRIFSRREDSGKIPQRFQCKI